MHIFVSASCGCTKWFYYLKWALVYFRRVNNWLLNHPYRRRVLSLCILLNAYSTCAWLTTQQANKHSIANKRIQRKILNWWLLRQSVFSCSGHCSAILSMALGTCTSLWMFVFCGAAFHRAPRESESESLSLYYRPKQGRKLVRKESEGAGAENGSDIWEPNIPSSVMGVKTLSNCTLSFFPLFSSLSPSPMHANPPAKVKCSKRGVCYYAWHVCRGQLLIWTWPSWSVSNLAQFQQCVCVCHLTE